MVWRIPFSLLKLEYTDDHAVTLTSGRQGITVPVASSHARFSLRFDVGRMKSTSSGYSTLIFEEETRVYPTDVESCSFD